MTERRSRRWSGSGGDRVPGHGLGADSSRDRGTSTALSYVLTLGITALLISGLLIAAGGTVESQRDATTREALEVVGQQLSGRLMAADRLVSTGADEVVVRGVYPDTVAGTTYSVTIVPGDPTEIELVATSVRVSVTVTAATRESVAATTVSGGDLEIAYDGGQLEVRAA